MSYTHSETLTQWLIGVAQWQVHLFDTQKVLDSIPGFDSYLYKYLHVSDHWKTLHWYQSQIRILAMVEPKWLGTAIRQGPRLGPPLIT